MTSKPNPNGSRVNIASVWADVLNLLEEGATLREICVRPGMPTWEGLRKFIRADDERVAQYAHARAVGAEALEDELLRAARSSGPEDASARRLQVDALKWVMSKRAPKVYGDKITQEHTGPNGGPMQVSEIRRVIVDPPKEE
ncbi:terminase small subunit-like protein [Komagataeibacter europaeus]|uniref:terminase small subunit-like protein n=1 Tax=Komagataeibacter europaeus TaxID=33995 RepID=UPI0035C10497